MHVPCRTEALLRILLLVLTSLTITISYSLHRHPRKLTGNRIESPVLTARWCLAGIADSGDSPGRSYNVPTSSSTPTPMPTEDVMSSASDTSDPDDSFHWDADFSKWEETIMDTSIATAVKKMVDDKDSPKEPELTPVEKFQQIYNDLKSRKRVKSDEDRSKDSADSPGAVNNADLSSQKVILDPEQMLELLFDSKPVRDPFDERKVIIKLRQMLDPEDFAGLFKDPNVGDLL